MSKLKIALFILTGILITNVNGKDGLILVQDGKSHAIIYIAANAPKEVEDAANECARVLKLMSNAAIAVQKVSNLDSVKTDQTAIIIGSLAEKAGLKMSVKSRAKDGFCYKVSGQHLLISGESPRGIYLGVFSFLETLGCGWYTPGEVGEVIPHHSTVVVNSNLNHSETSNSINRRFWYGGKNPGTFGPTEAWLKKINGNYISGSWAHAWSGLVSKKSFAEHPEYFGLSRGKRKTKQLCTTNPDVKKIAAESLKKRMKDSDKLVLQAGPNDGGGLCECSNCAKLDTPGYLEPSSGNPCTSSRIFKFANDLAEITSVDYPDRDLGILVYSEYSRIPKKLEKLHPNVFPMIAPIRRCRIHGPGNPNCKTAQLLKEEIQGWGKMSSKLGFYGYNYNLADTLVPFSKITYYKQLANEINKLDVEDLSWVFETIDSWATHAPHLYLSARLSWNSKIDIDKEMDRFYRGFYGATAEPMKRYWTRIDKAYADADVHCGSQYGLPQIWTDQLLKESRADIDLATKLTANTREKQAVSMAAAGLRCAELFMDIDKAVNAFDFKTAATKKSELQEHIKSLSSHHNPDWFHERYAWGYYQSFSGLTVDGGAKVISDGGKVIVKFPLQWKLRKDETGKGLEQGWQKPDFDDSSWQTIPAWKKSWAELDMDWYHGDAWCRVAFNMPKMKKDDDLRLWFGGFDHNVDVWVNGNHLGEKKGFAKPAEFNDIAKYLKYGEQNTLAVKVNAGGLAELGTGGIMKPVMIYLAGNKAKTPKTPDKKAAKDKKVDYEM